MCVIHGKWWRKAPQVIPCFCISAISAERGSFTKFVSHGDRVEITEYNGNASYPQNPSVRYTVERADGKVVEMENLTQ